MSERGMGLGGTGATLAPTAGGDAVAKGPSGIPGFYVIMWRGYALFKGDGRLVKAVDNG